MDIVLIFTNHKYVLELKRWAGEAAHRRGLKQLADYLERQGLDRGYLIVFDSIKPRKPLGGKTGGRLTGRKS
jgi:hypothetical protein